MVLLKKKIERAFQVIILAMCIICSYYPSSFAQNNLLSVKGVVLDESGKGLPYASVSLKDAANGQIVKGILTKLDGQFELKGINAGTYRLGVSMVGFKPYFKDIVLSDNQDIGAVKLLADATALAEVKISASRPLISKKIDRYVLNVSGSILSTGRSTFDLLNYAPGVITTGNSISINGNGATRVMVNGRLLRLSADQVQNYLANLRSEDLESIEVIPNPGAEFEAEGGGGLINIRLKRQRAGGLSGTLGLGALTPVYPSYNTNEQLNYGYKGLQLYASHNYTKRKTDAFLSDIRSNSGSLYTTDVTTRTGSNANNFRAGAGYDFSARHYLGVEFNGNINKSGSNSISEALLTDPVNNRNNRIAGDFLNKSKNKFYTASLNYDWKTDTLGSSFDLVADYSYADRNASGNFISHYRNIDNSLLFDSVYRNNVPVNSKNYNVGANYLQKLSKLAQLKFGVKFTQTNTENTVNYEYLKNGQYVTDLTRNNQFEYKEKIAAAYAQYSFDWHSTSFQIGLRGENTQTDGFSVTSGTHTERNYFNLFPSAYIKREINKNNTLSINYGRRMDRPTFNSLNPFEWRIDDYSYIRGNPYLKPQYTQSLNLSYQYLHKYDLTLFASRTDGIFAQFLTDEGNNNIIANYSWQNLNKQYYYGANLYLPVTLTKWWSMVNNLLIYRNSVIFPGSESKKNIFSGKSIQNISVTKTLRLELSGVYLSSSNMSNQIFVPNYYVDAGISKSLFSNKLSARLLVTDIFNTNRMDYRAVTGTSFQLQEKQKYTTRRVSVQFTYNFSIGKKVKVQKVEAGNAKEKDRM